MQNCPRRFKQVWMPIHRSDPAPTMDSVNGFEEGASWSDDESDINGKGTEIFHPDLALIDNDSPEEENPVSIDILPDDMHERILASLPLSGVFKACCVCKKWNQIVHSNKFTLKDSNILSDKTWYYMFTSSDEPLGYLYDSGLRKWYNFELPFMLQHSWTVAPSHGLVCLMDEESSNEIYVCNPITRDYHSLENPPSPGFSVYSALAFSVDRSQSNHKYTISVIRTMQASEDFLSWDVYIHVYRSKEKVWSPPVMGTMKGWRAGDVSVLCDNVLYILVFCMRTGDVQNCHGLVTYNLDNGGASLGVINEKSIISAPCPLTCGRLINMRRKLVLVGGIGRPDRPGVIKGIGIWVLQGREWNEIARMPHKYVQGFGEFDEVFASSGGGDLIYIQSYGGTALLVYDMSSGDWDWSQKCPMNKRFPLQIFSGFCFEPQLRFLS